MATMDSVAVVEQEAKATIAQTNVITKETKVSGAPVNVVNKDTLEQDTQEESVLVPFAADGAAYIYSQTPDALTVMLQVVPGIQTTEVDLEVTESGVSLMIRGTTVLRGSFFEKIIPTSVSWLLSEAPHAYSPSSGSMGVLSLFLDKAEQGRDWPLFIKSGFKGTLPSELDTHSLFLLANAVTASDPNTALKLYSYSADKGCIPALLKLGAWYELGLEDVPDIIPVKRNAQISLYYHTRAALAGSIEAAYFLMAAHCQGSHGLEKSYAKALEWAAARLFGIETLEETMPSVYTLAHWQAGLMWMEGSFGLDDPQPAKAADHWTRSGLKGHGPSLWNLGVFALNGFGIDQDIEQGIKNIKKGMELDETLRMPPQLEGLSEEELDVMALIAKEAISEAVAERANQEQSEPIVVNVVSLVKAAKKAVQDSRDGILPNVVTEGAVADEAHKPSRKTTAEPKEKRKKKQKASLGVSETSSPAWYKNPTVAMVLLPLAVIGIAVIARRAISSA